MEPTTLWILTLYGVNDEPDRVYIYSDVELAVAVARTMVRMNPGEGISFAITPGERIVTPMPADDAEEFGEYVGGGAWK